MDSDWDVRVGDCLTKAEIVKRYGSSPGGGMEPSARTPNMFLYTDLQEGKRHGYSFDGWASPDDDLYLYTGEGSIGDQAMTHGNLSLTRALEKGQTVRLFETYGTRSGSKAKLRRYIGPFRLDEVQPWETRESPDANGDLRSVFVFHLRPIGPIHRIPGDLSQFGALPEQTDVSQVDITEVDATDLEYRTNLVSERQGSQPASAVQREAELVDRFTKSLLKVGHKVGRYRIRPAGSTYSLWTDIADMTDMILYEAKGVTTRESVRMALGQLLDYRRFVGPNGARLLLPSRPSDDLIDLIHGLDVGCIYETRRGTFVSTDR